MIKQITNIINTLGYLWEINAAALASKFKEMIMQSCLDHNLPHDAPAAVDVLAYHTS